MCERLADIVARFGGSRSVVGEASRDFIARLPGGRVFGPGIVLSPDGRSLARDVSNDFGKPFDQHWLLTYRKIRPPVRVDGQTAVVAVTLGAGYCHWLLEELPRLLFLCRGKPITQVIAHGGEPFIREALAAGGLTMRVLEAGRYSHFECEELVIPGLVGSLESPDRCVVEMLAEFTAPLRARPASSSARGGRLYITRENARRRRVANEGELWSRLEARGFTKVRAEELSWQEQIAAFARAKVIVAPHGAGLANLAFCRPGTRVVELFNRAYVNPCFARLAEINGLDHRAVVAAGAGEPRCDLASGRCDISADWDAVERALQD